MVVSQKFYIKLSFTEGFCSDCARTQALHSEIEKSNFSKAAGKKQHLSLFTWCFYIDPENRLQLRHLCSSQCYKLTLSLFYPKPITLFPNHHQIRIYHCYCRHDHYYVSLDSPSPTRDHYVFIYLFFPKSSTISKM